MDMKFGMWNLRWLYRTGFLMTYMKELIKCRLDLVGLQEVIWDRSGTEPVGEYAFFC
jgi:hypothetical protein